MLLSEQERILSSEKMLMYDPETFSTTSITFGQIHDYGYMTVPNSGIVYFVLKASINTVWGLLALYIGGIPVEVNTINFSGAGGTFTLGGAVQLNSGTYDVSVSGNTSNSSYTLSILSLQVAMTKFNDCAAYALQASTSASLTVNGRKTPVGPLKMAVFAINASGQAPSGQAAGISSITVDGMSMTFDESCTSTCVSASVKCYVPLSVGTSHTITVTPTNSSQTTYLSVIACPWILTSASRAHQPVTLDFPQQSTLYVIVTPLFLDASVKECYVGYPKGINWGAANYYSYASAGTGAIVSFSYTFDSVNTLYVIMSADALGCCIDNIAVDMI